MEKNKDVSDSEDIPSDFFDDFNKDEFMEGLSVIDSWDDGEKKNSSRINSETVDSVKDLRELITEGKEDNKNRYDLTWELEEELEIKHRFVKEGRHSTSRSRLDDYIKPGSRRDPNKTNAAIRRDKEVKVKQHLAKHLESDIRPPGTELDDFFDEKPPAKRRSSVSIEEDRPPSRRPRSRSYERYHRGSPGRRWVHKRSPLRHSPFRSSHSQWSPRRCSPQRKYGRNVSPPLRSSHRYGPQRRSPHRSRHSRSPERSSYMRRSRSPHYRNSKDTFLYPNDPNTSTKLPPIQSYHTGPGQSYPCPREYTGGVPEYTYAQGPAYAGGYSGTYEYAPSVPPVANAAPVPFTMPCTPVPQPQPVPAPVPPAIVPPQIQIVSPIEKPENPVPPDSKIKFDALAQLVIDGKLSREDYLKLAPHKGASIGMDTNTRVMVLNRCSAALSKLSKLLLPNSLVMSDSIIGAEPKYLVPKYCSPLKKQAAVEFHFTNPNDKANAQQNKQLIDSIIATVGLEDFIARPKKKVAKNMQDVAVQTTKPYCDVCEIRESTRFSEAGTEIDREHLSSTVHTQVVEQDLISSKAIFNPSGSIADGAPISIAHLTPAQLVSQLAAKAKTLKQSIEHPQTSNQYERRNPPSNYDGRGGRQQYNNYNYHY